jgi:hypothetical protein
MKHKANIESSNLRILVAGIIAPFVELNIPVKTTRNADPSIRKLSSQDGFDQWLITISILVTLDARPRSGEATRFAPSGR